MLEIVLNNCHPIYPSQQPHRVGIILVFQMRTLNGFVSSAQYSCLVLRPQLSDQEVDAVLCHNLLPTATAFDTKHGSKCFAYVDLVA